MGDVGAERCGMGAAPIERRLCRRYIEQAVRDGDLDEELLPTETNRYSPPPTSSGKVEVNGGSPSAAE
jgi:hypothetical protein